MTTRSPYFAAAQGVAASTSVNEWPKGWLGVARNTTDQSLGAVSGATGYQIDFAGETVYIHTNRMIRVHATATVTCVGALAAARCSLQIIEGGTTIGRGGQMTVSTLEHPGDGTQSVGSDGPYQFTGWAYQQAPTNGTHTYSLQLYVHSVIATPTLTVSGSSPAQAQILIEDIGAAS